MVPNINPQFVFLKYIAFTHNHTHWILTLKTKEKVKYSKNKIWLFSAVKQHKLTFIHTFDWKLNSFWQMSAYKQHCVTNCKYRVVQYVVNKEWFKGKNKRPTLVWSSRYNIISSIFVLHLHGLMGWDLIFSHLLVSMANTEKRVFY